MLTQIPLNEQHRIISRIFLKHPSLTGKIILISNTALDAKVRVFRYKFLHNILCANKMLLKFGKVTSLRCSFCKLHDETIMHFFHDSLIVNKLWNQLKPILSNNLIVPISTPQSAIFGFWDLDTDEHLILNYLLIIFKMYIYNAKTTGYLNITHLLIFSKGMKYTEKKTMWEWS